MRDERRALVLLGGGGEEALLLIREERLRRLERDVLRVEARRRILLLGDEMALHDEELEEGIERGEPPLARAARAAVAEECGDVPRGDLRHRLRSDPLLEEREVVRIRLDRVLRVAGLLQEAAEPVAAERQRRLRRQLAHQGDAGRQLAIRVHREQRLLLRLRGIRDVRNRLAARAVLGLNGPAPGYCSCASPPVLCGSYCPYTRTHVRIIAYPTTFCRVVCRNLSWRSRFVGMLERSLPADRATDIQPIPRR